MSIKLLPVHMGGVTSDAQTGDTDVTRTISKPLGKGKVARGGDEQTTTPPDVDNEKSDVELVIDHHCDLHFELLGITILPQMVSLHNRQAIENLLASGITADFFRKVIKQRLAMRRAKNNRQGVSFSYWLKVIPDEWEKCKPATRSAVADAPAKPLPPKPIEIADSHLRALAEAKHPIDDWPEWAEHQAKKFADDEVWKKAKTRLENIIGEAKFVQWIEPLRVVWCDSTTIGLVAPTSFIKNWVETHHMHDLQKATNRHIIITI